MAGFVDLTSSLGQKIRHDNLRLVGQTLDYNPGIDGREQVLYTENRVWRGSIVFPPMFGSELALLRSIPTRLRGRAGVLRIPLLNLASPRFTGDQLEFWQSVGVPQDDIDRGSITFADDATFEDDSGFDPPPRSAAPAGTTVHVSQPLIQVRLAADDAWLPFIKGVPVYGMQTYFDQKRRHPTDEGLQFVTEAGRLITWTNW